MVDLSDKIHEIKKMVDAGQYFTINRVRQYGKTTTLQMLEKFLVNNYQVISLDFQMLSHADFKTELDFVAAFSREVLDVVRNISVSIQDKLIEFSERTIYPATLSMLFKCLEKWCEISEKNWC